MASSKKPAQKPKEMLSLPATGSVRIHAEYAWWGLQDACAWPTTLIAIYTSTTIKNGYGLCLAFNGVIFFGGWLFLRSCRFILNAMFNDRLFTAPFHTVLALFPIFVIGLLVNSLKYQQIASRAYEMQTGGSSNASVSAPATYKFATEIYRYYFFFWYTFIAALAYHTPYFGSMLSFILVSWISAFYCFEYKWINLGWNFRQRLDYFEEHWAYFAGFGLPLATVGYFFSIFTSTIVFGVTFPAFIVMATFSTPKPRRKEVITSRLVPNRIPVFLGARKCSEGAIFVAGKVSEAVNLGSRLLGSTQREAGHRRNRRNG